MKPTNATWQAIAREFIFGAVMLYGIIGLVFFIGGLTEGMK